MRNVFDEVDDMDFDDRKLNWKQPKEKKVNLRIYDRDTIFDKLRSQPKTGGYYDTEHFRNKVKLEDIKEKQGIQKQRAEIRTLKRTGSPHSSFAEHNKQGLNYIMQGFRGGGGFTNPIQQQRPAVKHHHRVKQKSKQKTKVIYRNRPQQQQSGGFGGFF